MTYQNGLLTSFANRNGHTAHLDYDPAGLLTQDTDPLGGFSALQKSDLPGGFRVTKSSALGRVTTYDTTYDAAQRHSLVVTAPTGLQSTYLGDPAGIETTQSPDGVLVTRTKTADPRFGMTAPLSKSVVKLPSGLSSTTEETRNVSLANPADPFSATQITETAKLNGKAWTRVYDVVSNVQTSTSPTGRTTLSKFDGLGHLVELDVPGVLPMVFAYDADGRLTTATQGARVSHRTYGADGLLATATDPLGQTSTVTRDLLGRVLTEQRPDLAQTSYAYDGEGNTVQVVPPGKPPHDFTFDAREELTAYEPPILASGATDTGYSYNLDRQPSQVAQPGPRLIDYQYDAAGRLTQTTFPTGVVTRSYDAVGRLAAMNGPTGVNLSYSYDGNLLTAMGFSGLVNGTVARAYDADFRIVSETVDGAWPATFTYDADGLLTSAGGMQIFRDPLNGRLTGTQIGQVSDVYTYDAFGAVASYTASFGVTPFLSWTYVRDDLGRIIQKTEVEDGVSTVFGYSYDLAGRLVEVTRNGVVTEAYEYDLNGNRIHSVNSGGVFEATYDEQDRILTYGTLTFQWTPNGEMASKTDTATGEVTTYSYDAVGNLREVGLPDGTTITYLVDGQGRRVGKLVDGVFERGWLWREQLQPVAEVDATGAVSKRFVYAGGVNVPHVMVTAGGTYRLVEDHLGSVRRVVEEGSGAVAERIAYDAWGRVGVDTAPGAQPFGFAGGLTASSASETRFGIRDYLSDVGAWMTLDPTGPLVGAANRASYCNADPVNRVDPTGQYATEELVEVVVTLAAGGAVGAADYAVLALLVALPDNIADQDRGEGGARAGIGDAVRSSLRGAGNNLGAGMDSAGPGLTGDGSDTSSQVCSAPCPPCAQHPRRQRFTWTTRTFPVRRTFISMSTIRTLRRVNASFAALLEAAAESQGHHANG
jgi:RHS repeat-associated protein